ncbi:MAG TPA: hypothetical protein VFG14_05970 [Chthoniobacteraceae bacterium]|nr:hypothetical protein [Chthoniobacteraceae bacterium]
MGFLGRVTGWEQQKDAHNAVLANHLARTAGPDLRREIVKRLILLQQQVRGRGAGDPHAILTELNAQTRIVQMNFIALACNSLGIPPALSRLGFEAVENPYRSENESSLARIDVAMRDLSRRSGERLNWPGNQVRIDFYKWGGLQLPSQQPGQSDGSDVAAAVDLAFRHLLLERVPQAAISEVAGELSKLLGSKAPHALALAAALFFFEQQDLKGDLQQVQMFARLKMLEWLEEGRIEPGEGQYFANQLYELYKL